MPNIPAIIGTPTVRDVTEDANLQRLVAAGSISISDQNPGQAYFRTSVISAAGDLGTLTLAANGSYSYSVADSAVQYLGAGDTKVDSFIVTSADGTTKQVSFTIHGINDAAIIGTPTVRDVTEDTTRPVLTATGTISISDADQGEAAFGTTVSSAAGNLGTLTLAANGSYSYAVADSAVQFLGAGATKTDTFTVTSLDGTARQVSFTIHGVNDAAVIGAPTVHDVTEDATHPLLTATGTISITDADQGEAAFRTTVMSAAGNLGTLTLATNGSYSYAVADSAVQYLGTGATKTDTFTVTSIDGTSKQVTFTIHGVNDAAVIGTPTVHDVTEDATHPLLFAIGTISITDADQGEASFKTTVISAAGNLGGLIVASNGGYAYAVADSAVQYLGASDTKVDTFTVTSLDGTTRQIAFTIHGTNDVAVIGAPTVRDVTEDSNPVTLTAVGTMSISDADQGQAAFKTTVVSAAGNLGTLTLAANGSYSYSVADSAVQFLGAGDVKTDSFSVTSLDGTARQVTFTIHGVNDAAVIGTPTVHDVNADPSLVTLTAAGSISISDADQGQAAFKTGVISAAGNLGQLTLASNGSYSYSVAESLAAQLGAGGSKVDTFTVTALDGTTKQVSFTIHGVGSNHPAVIGDPSVHDVTEDAGPATLTASGSISIADADAGQAAFQTAVTPASGSLGTLVLASAGAFTYSVANSATQYLGAGDSKIDTFTVTSLDGTTKQISFTIHGVNDTAVIGTPSVHDVTEDASPTTLTATGTIPISDIDQGQASFQTMVSPAAGDLGSLAIASNGAYTYSVANSATQHLGAGDTKVDSFTVTALDGTTQQVAFTIHGVQDAPSLTVGNASGLDNTGIPLSISAAMIDSTGTLAPIEIDGLPSGYILNHGTVLDDGSTWVVAPGDLPTLAILPAGGTATAGTFNLHVKASSIEGSHQATSTADITVTVTPSAAEVNGRVVDGYIAGATVFADSNHNGVLDAGEAHSTTHADGSFTLSGGSGPLVMFGGTDVSTGVNFSGVLTAPEGSTVITPLTTLIAALTSDTVSAAQAASQVSAAFGLDPSVDLTTFDPVPAAVAGNGAATAILSAAIQVQSTVAQISAVGGSADAVFSAIADTISTASGSSSALVDLSASTTVQDIVANSGVDAAAATTVVSVVTAANDSIQSATDVTSLAQAGAVAQGAATEQLAATDFGNATQVAALQQAFVTDLGTQVANAVVGDVDGAQLGTLGNDVLTGGNGNDSIDGLDGNDQISGGAGNDFLYGSAGNDRLTGGAGNDKLDGGTGFDRAVFSDATGSVTINLAAGTASGAGVGTDTMTGIEGVVGSNYADTYDATGFAGVSGVPGTPIGFNEFEGGAGNDTIIGSVNALGAPLTRVSYVSATAGVTVDLAAKTADGDASVGHDTFVGSGVFAVWGSGHDDTLLGSNNPFGSVEVFSGFAGNDTINGRGGFDRADYNQDPTTTSGIAVHLAAGIVTGDATVGTDTLLSVEGVRGTNFADVYDATGFSGNSVNAGSFGTFNEFTGNGGDDTIIGNGNTRITYNNATAGVTVDIAAGTADGDASVGHDTFTGVNAAMGSMFADTLLGSAGNETFFGLGGNDYIDGRGGFDTVSYNNIYLSTGGINVSLAAGIVTGDASIGTDTLRSIEGIQGTVLADTYDATGYGLAGALNVGNNGNFNQFEGLGGNDVIIGNGNTRVAYFNASAGVTVNLQAGTVTGDASVGTDTIVGGVNSAAGSAFADTLIGDGNSNTFVGGGGNDSIDGGAGGDIAVFSGVRADYTISTNTPGAGQTQIADSVAGRDGTDTLTNVEIAQFSNASVLLASGSAATPVDISDNRLFFGPPTNALTTLTGSSNDFLKIGFSLSGHQIDLGAGSSDTVMLGVTGGYNLNLVNVENVVGTAGNDFVNLVNNANGLAIDLGAGSDNLNLAGGSNTLSVSNVENIFGTDFAAGTSSDDTLTLLNNVSGLSVNLANGSNTLNLAVGTNSFTDIFSVQHINGTAGDDVLTVTHAIGTLDGNPIIDLGGGDNTMNVDQQGVSLTALNVQHLNGDSEDNFFTLNNNVNGIAVDLGAGTDYLSLARGSNSLSAFNIENINGSDFGGTNPSDDTLTLLNDVSGVTINLGDGNNTLNLAAGTNTLAAAYNLQAINGTASNDSLTLQNLLNGPTIDLGDGTDALTLADGFNSVTVRNIENVFGGNSNDDIVIANTSGSTTVTAGLGADTIVASAGQDNIRFTSAVDSQIGNSDQIVNFDAAHDTLVFDHMSGGPDGLIGPIDFIGSNAFDGNHVSEARLDSFGGVATLQIDVNGDGVMDANDIQIQLTNLTGTLSNANFVVPDQAPTDIILAGSSVPENSPNGTVVGLLAAVDPDAGDTATFSLTNDANGLFAISGANLVVAGPLDYETATSQRVTVRVTDSGGLSYDKSFTIGVTNVNEAPTNIVLSGNSVAENSVNGTVIGAISAIDPDAGDSATFSLANDANGLFAISGGNLVVAGPLDFETANSQQITLRVIDSGGLSYDKSFTIGVTNVNEAPTNIVLSGNSVAENSANGTVVGALSAIDPDAGDSATFSLTGNANGLFAISGGNLVVAGPLDYETATSQQLTVSVTDSGGLSYDKNFVIGVTNVNEAPTDISISNATLPQSSAAGTVVGALAAIDPDAGDSATFSLLDDAGGEFAINGSNLVVAASLSAATQQVIVRATDSGGLTFDKAIAITVNAGATIVGDANNNTLVGTAGDDVIQGLAGNDRLQGLAGNDLLDGGTGFDRAVYSDATGGITVNMVAGTVSGPGVGNDTLVAIEGVAGSDFVDTYDATGFAGVSGNVGTPTGFNEFEGRGGDDVITGTVNSQGAPLTRVSYISATAAVTVDLAAKTATGDASVGHDTFVGNGVGNVTGSQFGDTLLGSSNPSGTSEVFEGRGGNDLIDGRGGFDRADYNNDPATTAGITVNLAAGTVIGDATVGTDTLRSVEAVRGTNFADTYSATGFGAASTNAGSNGTFNEFTGNGGNDSITGNGNTRLSYQTATSGVTVDIAAGTADGDASVGHDTFTGVNAINASFFDDTLLGSAGNETFTGYAGNDFIDGRGGFDTASYNNIYFTTGGISVNLATGTVVGDASIGTDTLRSIEGIQGTNFADSFVATGYGLAGALNVGNNGNFNQFEGLAGDDSITGNCNTRILYTNATGGVVIHLQAGTAIGDSSVGNDSFVGVNSALGSNFADTYDATGFNGVTSAGAFGPFNSFQGQGGDDLITGNGNTQLLFGNATAGVIVDLTAGTASGDASVGHDTITGGVNSVIGSNFNDTITGSSANENFSGGTGNDTINGGGGNDVITGGAGDDIIDGGSGGDVAVYAGPRSAYTITSLGSGQFRVADSNAGPDGTDTLSNVEVAQFSDSILMLTSGTAGIPVDISGINFAGSAPISGTAGDDFLSIGPNLFGHQINLGAGVDTLELAGAGFYGLNLAGVENITGSAGDDSVNLANNVSGISIDLQAGHDFLTLAGGVNSLAVTNVENISSGDFGGVNPINDTLTLLDDVSGVTINLGDGDNTLNLAAGSNSVVDMFDVQHVNGTAANDTLTFSNTLFSLANNPIFDLGAGDDTLTISPSAPAAFASFSVLNVEHLNGNDLDNFFTLNNDVSGIAIDLGGGNDTLTLAHGDNTLSALNIENINGSDFGGAPTDISDDTLTLLNDVSGVTINLLAGNNTLNLAAGDNMVTADNIQAINGTASDDTLTLQAQINGSTVDLGAGTDTLRLADGFNSVTVNNIENVFGGNGNDNIVIANTAGSTTVTGGLGTDTITASAGQDNFRFTSAAESSTGNGDQVVNFDAGHDAFIFDHMTGGANGLTGPITFVGSNGFDGTAAAPQSEARLDTVGGVTTLQIDVNGDGVMGANDIEIHLVNLTGTLTNSNFILT